MSDLISIEVEPGSSPKEWSWLERSLLNTFRRVPGMNHVAGSGRLLTAFRGSAWTLIGYGGSQLLRLASMVVLARHLLGPKAFGLVALVNVYISGLNLLSDLGIGTDVIQHPRGDEPGFLNTAFLIGAGRGAILWVLASALAYPFALFYHQPAIFALVLAAASTVLISGVTSPSQYTLIRHVRLGKLTLLRMGAEACGLVASIVWAIFSPTAWALVIGRIAAELFFTIGTHVISERPVSLLWDSSAAKAIIAFGAGMFASSATYFLAGEAERLVVGKFVDLIVLGCFSLALSITSAATGGLQRLLGQVFFPMIASSARADRELAANHYRKVRLLMLAISACMAIAFIGGGKWIVAVLLGPKYLMAGWILQLMGFRAALELFMSITTQMLFALGTSKYAAAGNITKLIFLGIGLTIAFGKFGFREAVWVLAISPVFAYIPLLLGIRSHFRVVLRTELAAFAVFLAAAGVATMVLKVAA